MHDPTKHPQETQNLPAEGSNLPSNQGIEFNDDRPTGKDVLDAAAIAVDFQPIDPRFIPAERLAALILFIATTFGSVVACIVMWLSSTDQISMVLAGVGLTLLCLSFLWNAIFWAPIEHRHIQWKLSDVGLEIRRGVFWKNEIAIPWARAQHADVSQGPIQRIFEIGSLTIHTAGTKNSSVTIDGLAHDQALELRDEIIRQRKEHDVV